MKRVTYKVTFAEVLSHPDEGRAIMNNAVMCNADLWYRMTVNPPSYRVLPSYFENNLNIITSTYDVSENTINSIKGDLESLEDTIESLLLASDQITSAEITIVDI